MTVLEAVEQDLDRMSGRDPGVGDSPEGEAARALARHVDSAETSPTACALAVKELRRLLADVRASLPAAGGDALDAVMARRQARVAERDRTADVLAALTNTAPGRS